MIFVCQSSRSFTHMYTTFRLFCFVSFAFSVSFQSFSLAVCMCVESWIMHERMAAIYIHTISMTYDVVSVWVWMCMRDVTTSIRNNLDELLWESGLNRLWKFMDGITSITHALRDTYNFVMENVRVSSICWRNIALGFVQTTSESTNAYHANSRLEYDSIVWQLSWDNVARLFSLIYWDFYLSPGRSLSFGWHIMIIRFSIRSVLWYFQLWITRPVNLTEWFLTILFWDDVITHRGHINEWSSGSRLNDRGVFFGQKCVQLLGFVEFLFFKLMQNLLFLLSNFKTITFSAIHPW